MDIVSLVNNISQGFIWSKSFTIKKLLEFTNDEINPKILRGALLNNQDFIFIKTDDSDHGEYILKSSLFKWFVLLNLHLAEEKIFKISKSKLSLLMSLGLRMEGVWSEPPRKIIEWAMNLGLLQTGFEENRFVFPISGILSFLTPNTLFAIKDQILEDFMQERPWNNSLNEKVENYLDQVFENISSILGERTVLIIKHRMGLLTGSGETLEQIGQRYGITRERVRQIEKKFWQYAHHPSRKITFLKAIICYLMLSKSNLVIDANPHGLSLISFLAKWAQIPLGILPFTGLSIFGLTLDNFKSLTPPHWSGYDIKFDKVEKELDSDKGIFLAAHDIDLICKRISAYRSQKHRGFPLSSRRMIYLALRDLGKPSHYSDITRIHNELFPQVIKTERIIHATLGRCADDFVWIGVKGTYALKEWGYKKPSKGLFDSVDEIVRNIYLKSNKPVAFSVIVSELGKYRQVINNNSLLFAVHMNAKVQEVSNNLFIPKIEDKQVAHENDDNFDKVLREFRPNQ